MGRTTHHRWSRPALATLVAVALLGAACSGDDAGDGAAPADAGLAGCAEHPLDCNSGDRAEGGTATWALGAPWSSYNTLRVEGADAATAAALAGIAPGIGDFAPDGQWQWNRDLLASDPEITVADPQTMVYELRPEAVWDDGTPISVDDFRYTWFQMSGRDDQCVGCNAKYTIGWEDVASVEGTDEGRTVTITMNPGITNAEWFALFEPSPYPAHLAEAAGFDWRTPEGMGKSSEHFRDTLPTWSGGPYRIDSVVDGERVVMVPNPEWYGEEQTTLDRIVKEVVPPSEWALAVRNGELDGGSAGFDPNAYDELRELDGVTTSIGAGDTWEHLDLNLRAPALQDEALRKAIFTAIDVRDARDRIFGDVAPALRTNHFFPSSSPYHEDLLEEAGFGSGDIEAARGLLTDAGYTGAEPGQRLAKDGVEVPALRFAFISANAARSTFVELAQSYLAELGIEVTPQPGPAAGFIDTLGGGDYDLVIWALSSGPTFTNSPNLFFATDSPVNFNGYSDVAFDAAADEVLTFADVAEAAAAANAADELVVDRAVNLPLWDNPAFAFASDRLVNVRDDTFSYVRAMYAMQAWGIRAD
jgi:peptide/nickel transport system substrate-binding protein